MILLLESKRDDLLLPYLNILKQNGVEKTLGQFKGEMLDKLAAQGGMHNLSQSSNYYLAGAVRYYFEGMLTTAKPTYLKTGDSRTPDAWNNEVCKRLNALVNVLRDAYIDTIGTKFEQPEDFGELSLPKLLRKYNKQINKELGIESEKSVEKTLDENPNVGNGYTFDILYSFADATKYERYTAPGSWCITYGQGHYDYYRNKLDCHYVIFLKNGYENIPREIGPGYTKDKPHDAYGNSMIAYLQSNKSWKPTYITSRWNHGHSSDNTNGTQADYAYNINEFCKITGVKQEDLERIYEIWKTKTKNEGITSYYEKKQLSVGTIRKLKYAQMKANGGESLLGLLKGIGATISIDPIYGNGDEKKSVYEAQLENFTFLVDRGKVVFDSVIYTDDLKRCLSSEKYFGQAKSGEAKVKNLIVFQTEKYSRLYNVRAHAFLDIDGQSKFKTIPKGNEYRGSNLLPTFFEVKLSGKDIALISTRTNMPLTLPNGAHWFNDIDAAGFKRYWESRNQLHSHFFGGANQPIIKITYDLSSGEEYFFNTVLMKFVDVPDASTNNERLEPFSWGQFISDPHQYKTVIYDDFMLPGYYAIAYSSYADRYGNSYCTSPMLFNNKGQRVYIYGKNKFKELRTDEDKFIVFSVDKENRYSSYRCFYDPKFKRMLAIGNQCILTSSFFDSRSGGRFMHIEAEQNVSGLGPFKNRHEENLIYDTTNGLFLKNIWSKTGSYGTPFFNVCNDDTGFYLYYDMHSTSDISNTFNVDWNEAWKMRNKFRVHVSDEGVVTKWSDDANDFVETGEKLEYFDNNFPINDEMQPGDNPDEIPTKQNQYNVFLGNTQIKKPQEDNYNDILEEDVRAIVENVLKNLMED